jgi:hypothetical protein
MAPSKRESSKPRILEEAEERDRAKQIILYILKQAGGALGKSRLFKAFWLAHLYYAKNAPGYLSSWKIVRLPHGPGIDKGDELILQMKKTGDVAVDHEPRGPYTEMVCKLTEQSGLIDISEEAIKAIKIAVKVVTELHDSVEQISEWSHEVSRSWGSTPNGEELDIYSDLIPDDVYLERQLNLKELNEVYDDLLK